MTANRPPSDQASSESERSPRTTAQRLIVLIGGLGPLGHAPASGTVTVAVVGVPAFVLATWLAMPLWAYLLALAVLTGASVWVHDVGDRILGEKDSRRLVLDELVGYFIAMIAVSLTWQLVVLGFFIERFIDIAKIPPARQVERRVPGGWGVVGDDVIAGLYTLGLLHLASWLVPNLVGL